MPNIKFAVAIAFFAVILTTIPVTAAASPRSALVHVIISFTHDTRPEQVSSILAGNNLVSRQLSGNTVAASLPYEMVQWLTKDPHVLSIENDVPVTILDSGVDSQIQANQVWPLGVNGSGVRLAILDTGIDTTHPEFQGRILACHTEVPMTTNCEDDNGH